MGGRRLIPNPYRGERWVDLGAGDRFIARPTLAAIVTIESEHGPWLDIAAALGDPSQATLGCLGGSLETWLAAGPSPNPPHRARIEQAAIGGGMARLLQDAQSLLWTYFDAGRPKTGEQAGEARAVDDRAFPWREMVGAAIAFWGASPDEAWGMTAPEWWAALDAQKPVKTADGPTPLLSGEKARQMARELRVDARRDMQEMWRTPIDRIRDRPDD